MKLLIDGKWIGDHERHNKGRDEAIARYNKVQELKKQKGDEYECGSDELHER